MKYLVAYILFLPIILYSQKRDSVYFSNTFYKGIYSEVKEQPLFIEYEID